MTDREMLELAAKAVGFIDDKTSDDESSYGLRLSEDGEFYLTSKFGWCAWNPLTDDGDALRLMVALEMQVDQQGNTQRAVAMWQKHRTIRYVAENFDGNPLAATRRAITRAAAETGKAMP